MADQFESEIHSSYTGSASQMANPEPVHPTYTNEQLKYFHDQQKYTKHAVEGARWFYWLAGLSVINSLIAMFDGSVSFIFGMGITQVIDAIAFYTAQDMLSQTGLIVKIIGLVLSIFISGIAFLIGYLSLKGKKWAMYTGTGLYIVDLLICLFFGLYLDAFFHLFVLIFIIRGAIAYNKLGERSEKPVINPVIPLHQ
jgi:hypothetical protein